jgi:hypothetical protein
VPLAAEPAEEMPVALDAGLVQSLHDLMYAVGYRTMREAEQSASSAGKTMGSWATPQK